MSEQFQVKSDLELWAELDMDVERFKNVPPVLTQVYKDIFLSQNNRPEAMAYFDDMISNIYTGRIQEMVDAKKAGHPVIGTFCVYVPEEVIHAAGGVCVGLCGGSQATVPDAEKTLAAQYLPNGKICFRFQGQRDVPLLSGPRFCIRRNNLRCQEKNLGAS
ncbi:2-hydroxyacyl-CoA dehydratase [uncultured Desulfuromusa sp.]|uniref:2-hydroxyacyl-CoA dehydratase n=1 Tax=uncultured Desulfuromusa sp. TaxID=219183 RepID=UPI002D1E4482|nr:2-hydroxyacyl-CoA dehydratase [uncultured Desulfuromusa sp.]